MDLWSPEFWVVVTGASTFATVLASIITLAVTAWWRKLDETHADWTYYEPQVSWSPSSLREQEEPTPPRATFRVSNAGDGSAFQVRVTGHHCEVKMHSEDATGSPLIGLRYARYTVVPLITPGEGFRLSVHCDPRLWDVAAIAITWKSSPTWRKNSLQRVVMPLSDVSARPSYSHSVYNEATNQFETVALPEPEFPTLTQSEEDSLSDPKRSLRAFRQDLKRQRRAEVGPPHGSS